MKKELKEEIIKWLFNNENCWQRLNSCKDEFEDYIYDRNGDYLIGGKEVSSFISESNELIYNKFR